MHFGGQRKGAEEGRASRVEPLARPFGGRTRVPVEPREIQPAEDSVLVITGHDRARARADQVHASRGVRSVPDDVAEADEVRAVMRLRIREHGFESFEVGVDVSEDGYSHRFSLVGAWLIGAA